MIIRAFSDQAVHPRLGSTGRSVSRRGRARCGPAEQKDQWHGGEEHAGLSAVYDLVHD